MRFASPEVLLLLFVLPILVYFNKKKKNKSEGIPFPTLFLFQNEKPGFKTWLCKTLFPIRLLIFILIIFSLARFQSGYERIEEKIKLVDIILAIDVSKSMLAEDMYPKNRILAAKNVIADFIKVQKENRIGMVAFSGKSFTMSPLTFDYDILLEILNEIDVETVKIDGTAIGEAIANSLFRFGYDPLIRSRVIILLTDGENNSGKITPKMAAEMALIKKVKIYTIGVGKPKGTPIPLVNPYTGESDYARDINGNILYSKVNEPDLIKIAKITGGEYFRATDTNTLQNIYNKINELEKSEIITNKFKNYNEKMYYFLIPAFVLMIFYFIMNIRVLNPVSKI